MKVKNINSECESTSSSSTAQNMKISWEVPQQNKCIKYSNDYFIAKAELLSQCQILLLYIV